MFYFFGVGLNFFLFLLLISKKNKSLADNVLAAWLFIIGCHLLLYVLSVQPITIDNIHQMGLSLPIPFLHGPFLYLYTAAVTRQLTRKREIWIHFIPAVVITLSLMPFFLSSSAYKMEVFNNKGESYATFLSIAGWCMKVSGIVYVVSSFVLLRKHKKNIGNLFSYDEKINLNWLRYLIYALLVVWVIIIFIREDSFVFGAVVVCIFFLGFFGIRQVGIFSHKETIFAKSQDINESILPEKQMALKEEKEINENLVKQAVEIKDLGYVEEPPKIGVAIVKQKYSSSGLSEKMAVEIHEKLGRLMEDEKTFTNPELSLSILSTTLNVHPNYLSQVINEKENKNFFDYINNLRVEEFKKLVALPSNSQFTIMSIAYECGFNSKSSFNKNFKKVTGQSPSTYLAELKVKD